MAKREVYALYGVKDTYQVKAAVMDLVTGDAVANLMLNPENEDVTIIEAILALSTASSGSVKATDIGVAASGVSDDGLWDAGDTSAVGMQLSSQTATTGGLKVAGAPLTWGNGQYITQDNNGAQTNMVGKLIVLYLIKVQEGD